MRLKRKQYFVACKKYNLQLAKCIKIALCTFHYLYYYNFLQNLKRSVFVQSGTANVFVHHSVLIFINYKFQATTYIFITFEFRFSSANLLENYSNFVRFGLQLMQSKHIDLLIRYCIHKLVETSYKYLLF